MSADLPPCRPLVADVALPARPIVLVGLMGAGKTRIGGILARELDIPFVDSDMEVERAAGMSVADIFEAYGEAAFRDCEAKVIHRLVAGARQVIATGGGSFMHEATRRFIKEHAVSIWLKADLGVLLERTAQSGRRPLLMVEDPAAVLQRLMDVRYPVYAEADITLDSGAQPAAEMARLAAAAVSRYVQMRGTEEN
jgi:shikimate kinase